jgi:hypothetical protein
MSKEMKALEKLDKDFFKDFEKNGTKIEIYYLTNNNINITKKVSDVQ